MEIWSLLRSYFPSSPEFDGSIKSCSSCEVSFRIFFTTAKRELNFILFFQSSIDKLKNLSREIQELALMQKTALGDIFSDRSLNKWPRDCLKAFVVSKRCALKSSYATIRYCKSGYFFSFVQKWKSWVRTPGIDNQLKSVENSSLICFHKKLIFPLEENFGEGSESE